MGCESTRTISRQSAKERILEITRKNIIPERDLFLEKMELKRDNDKFTRSEFEDLKKNIDSYSDKMLENLMGMEIYRFSEFDNYTVNEEGTEAVW